MSRSANYNGDLSLLCLASVSRYVFFISLNLERKKIKNQEKQTLTFKCIAKSELQSIHL